MSATLTKRRVSRKYRTCGPHDCVIAPGDVYLEHTTFPGHDSGYATAAGRPVRMAECAWCAARYRRDHLLEPIPAAFEARYVDGLGNRGLL